MNSKQKILKTVQKRLLRLMVIGLLLASHWSLVSADPTSQGGKSSSAEVSTNRFINGAGDLHAHFTLHIKRVGILANALYQEYFKDVPGLDAALVKDFLNIHDQTKIDSSLEFRKSFWGFSGVESAKPFINRLFEFYNNQPKPDDVARKATLQTLVQELNATDKKVGEDFFRRRGLLNPDGTPGVIAQALLKIERLADVVDRNTDPVAMEEFGLKTQVPMSRFLTDPQDLAKATSIKNRYFELTREHQYENFMPGVGSACSQEYGVFIRSL